MINIPSYDRYNGEKKIALLDNSAIAFMHQLDNKGHKPEILLQNYDVIFIPEWVAKELKDSTFRVQYVEKLVRAGIPIYIINENIYGNLVNGEEIYLYKMIKASVSRIGLFLKYLRQYVEKEDLLDLDPYEDWIQEMYLNWPMKESVTDTGRIKKKNAGEISLTVLSEIFSWYYPNTEVLTIYTQDADTYAFQKNASIELKKVFRDTIPVSITYRSNDSIICELYRANQLTIEEVNDLRKDARTVTYTITKVDKTVSLETRQLKNVEFINMIQNPSMQIIF